MKTKKEKFENNLPNLLNKRGVYLESYTLCLVYLVESTSNENGMEALLKIDEDSKKTASITGNKVIYQSNAEPFGKEWRISKNWDYFYSNEKLWDASLYGGWYLFFDEKVVNSFLNEDDSWMEDYF